MQAPTTFINAPFFTPSVAHRPHFFFICVIISLYHEMELIKKVSLVADDKVEEGFPALGCLL